RAIRALANITCAVGVDHGAGHARRCIERTESGNGGNLPGGGDAAERNIRQQRIAAAGCEVIAGGCRVGEARRYREAENAVGSVSASYRLVHCEYAALRGGIVPVFRGVAPMPGSAGDVDQTSTLSGLEPVAHGEAGELGRGSGVEPKRVLPPVRASDVRKGGLYGGHR